MKWRQVAGLAGQNGARQGVARLQTGTGSPLWDRPQANGTFAMGRPMQMGNSDKAGKAQTGEQQREQANRTHRIFDSGIRCPVQHGLYIVQHRTLLFVLLYCSHILYVL